MKFDDKRKLNLKQLEESLCILDRSLETLRYSFSKCNSLEEKDGYTLKDQESFEALTSTQFERLSSLPQIQGRCRRAIVDYARRYLTPKMG